MPTNEWMTDRWNSVDGRVATLRQRMAFGSSADEAAIRHDVANILHSLTNLFELEIRRMGVRDRARASSSAATHYDSPDDREPGAETKPLRS